MSVVRVLLFCVPAVVAGLTTSCGPSSPSSAGGVHRQAHAPVRSAFSPAHLHSPWIDSVLASMTLEEKVGQLVMARASGAYMSDDVDEYARLKRLVTELHVGGLAMFQGDVYAEAVLLNRLQRLARVPLLVGSDFERGITMRVHKGTAFPSAMAIGATRNDDYAYAVGRAIGEEARAIGIQQNFAPVADINSNPANPVINTRSYGDDRVLVTGMVEAFVRGTDDADVLPTVKHFPGHGETSLDSHLDLPLVTLDRERLDSMELATFRGAIDSGVGAVMVGHLEVPAIDSTAGIPASLSPRVVQGLLRTDLGFEGLVLTDALEMQGLLRGHPTAQAAVMTIQAGADIVLVPDDEQIAINALLAAARSGAISADRLDTSVRRILATKERLHLNACSEVNVDSIAGHVGTDAHWMLSREIARNAVTVVKNDGPILPLPEFGRKRVDLLVLTDVDDARTEIDRPGSAMPNEPAGSYLNLLLRRRCGNVETSTISPSSNGQLLDSVLTRIKKADVLVLALYVKVRSGSGKSGLPDYAVPFIAKLESLQKPTVVLALGNPYIVGEFPGAQGVICAYGDAEVMVEAAVEAMFGEIPARGKLPVAIRPLYAFGSGLELPQVCLRRDDPEFAGFDPANLASVERIVEAAIRDSAFPGAQLAIARRGMLVYDKSFGTLSYDPASHEVGPATLYDLASLTKVFATTPAIMKLCDENALSLDDPVARYLPRFTGGGKDDVTIRQLLLHQGGLPAFRKLYDVCTTPSETMDSLYAVPLVCQPGDSTIYSDIGMVLLGKVVEKVSGVSLATFVTREFYDPLRMTNTLFNPAPAMRAACAPTEIDTVWRKRIVQGTVHDETAALLGGVSGNAGLFSTVSDLAVFMQMIMDGGTYDGVRYLSESTVHEFTNRPSAAIERALGWDLKAARNSSAGTLFSPLSFGHTGFTGTSVWADPTRELFVIFLTNRVYPTRANNRLAKVRPELHDAIISALLPAQAKNSGRRPQAVSTYR